MPSDQIRVVQFIHPGPEHRPQDSWGKPWNTNGHRRTFVEQRGRFVRGLQDRSAKSADLHFWCEWECEAELVRMFEGKPPKGYPRFLFRPAIESKENGFPESAANTDPCVFGSCFRYCVCKMRGKMKALDRGSVILFGSHLQGGFVIDTVFVVARYDCYDRTNWKTLKVENQYRDAALAPLFANTGCGDKGGDDQWWRVYEGATFENPIDGMFSFFPCLPTTESSRGFLRPRINKLRGFVNSNLNRGLKISKPLELEAAKEVWIDVVAHVLGAKLCLGVSADLPDYSSVKETH